MFNASLDNKTIEELENDYWVTPSIFPTELVKDIFFLRKKRLAELDSNDLRLLISQNIALIYLIPKTINLLKNNVLEEALYYPGDLLQALLNLDYVFWLKNDSARNNFFSIIYESKLNILHSVAINIDIKKDLANPMDEFVSSVIERK